MVLDPLLFIISIYKIYIYVHITNKKFKKKKNKIKIKMKIIQDILLCLKHKYIEIGTRNK